MRPTQLPSIPGISASNILVRDAVRAINQCQVYYARSKVESAAQAKLHAFFTAAAAAVAPGAFGPGEEDVQRKLTPAQQRAADAKAAAA